MGALHLLLLPLLQPRFLFFVAISLSCLAFHCNGACEVFKCGIYSLDYPFGTNGSGCGHPSLQLECDNVIKMPLINIGVYQYYVLEPKIFTQLVPLSYPAMSILYKPLQQDPCNLSEGIYDQFQKATMTDFHIGEGYINMTLGTTCTLPYPANLPCKEHSYYNLSLPDLKKYCGSEFTLPVKEIDLGKTLPQIIGEGIYITWNTTEYCGDCESGYRNCADRDTSSFCYCFSTFYSQECATVMTPNPVGKANETATGKSNETATGKSNKTAIKGPLIGGGVALAAVLVLFLVFYMKRRKPSATMDLPNDFTKPKGKRKGNDMERGQPEHKIGNLPIFSFEELQQATNFFDEKNELGDGGFGAVYLGKLIDGRLVAVKKLYQQHSRRIEQFINEVEIFANMNHPNLVRLYGCTHPESPVLLLVYEFLPNGTLADHLHGNRRRAKGLPWGTRLNIAIDTAQALAFLHSINPPVFHRDVKSTNILLDENLRAKVADFGLSRLVPVNVSHVTTAPQGTPGYVDPEYHQCFQLTEKSDVYSFGVVLMELISAKLAVDVTRKTNEISLAIMAVNKIEIGALQELVDPHLEIGANPEVKDMVTAVAELAFNCLANNRDVRPDMTQVASRLEQIKQLHVKDLHQQPSNPNGVALHPSPTSVQER